MNVTKREWLWTWSLVSLVAVVGCSIDKTDKKTTAIATETPVAALPAASMDSPKEDLDKKDIQDTKEPEKKKVVRSGIFDSNDNVKPVYFELSQSKLTENAQDTLKKNADWLKANPPMLVQIAGYTDTRGSATRNKTLAERRAIKVRDFYVAQGIPGERLITVALGSEEPTCDTVTDDCLAGSRRVETLVENKPLASR